MMESLPGDVSPFVPRVESPERCMCATAINCVAALAAARRQCGEVATGFLNSIDAVQALAAERGDVDAASILGNAGRLSGAAIGHMLDVIEKNEAVASAALQSCPGFRGSCGLSENEQADLTAIASRGKPAS